MKNWTLVFISVICFFTACNGQDGGGFSANPGENTLTCIVPGFDSVIYYYGGSSQMHDVKRGKISDTAFINGMFHIVKERGFLLALKPGDGANVLPDLREMVNLSNDHEVIHRSLDTLDVNEERTFGYTTPPPMKASIQGKKEPIKLNLPRDDDRDSLKIAANSPQFSRLVILLVGDNEIYAYPTGDIHKGKKYTYAECGDMLTEKKEDKRFSVMIKPAGNSTYRNTVNMLDEMKKVGIARYALVDITKEEEDYLRQIYR